MKIIFHSAERNAICIIVGRGQLATSYDGKPETRQYKAVFHIGKAEIGLTSDVVQTTARL